MAKWRSPKAGVPVRIGARKHIMVSGMLLDRRKPDTLVTEGRAEVVYVTRLENLAIGCLWDQVDRVRQIAGPGRIACPA